MVSRTQTAQAGHRVIIVDDEPMNRTLCRRILEPEGIACDEAANGVLGLAATAAGKHELVLLDVDMPQMQGTEVLRRLRAEPPCAHLKIIMLSGRATGDEMARMMAAGADDYLTKPFSVVQFRERVKAALRLKELQDQADQLRGSLMAVNGDMERALKARDGELIEARNALILGLAELASCRDSETGAHLARLQHYSRTLALDAAETPAYAAQLPLDYIDMLACCAPLHDIGKVGVPDHILQKPGKLTPEERSIMELHTVFAAETLHKVAARHRFALGFLQMAIEIARHHHERWDGSGYPDRLSGESIPLAARIVSIGDVYDALRMRRVYKPSISHEQAVEFIVAGAGTQFDPALIPIFERCAGRFEQLFSELTD